MGQEESNDQDRKATNEAERSLMDLLGVVTTHGNPEVASEIAVQRVVELRRVISGLLTKGIITQDKHDRLSRFLSKIERAAEKIV